MTGKRSRNYVLSFIVPFIAILIASVAIVAQAQMTAAGQQSAYHAVLSAPQDSARLRALQHLVLPGTNNAERTPATRGQSDKLAAGPMASDPPLFLFTHAYTTLGAQGARSVAVEDVNNDGKPDLLVASDNVDILYNSRGVVEVLLGNGDGAFTYHVPYSYDSGGWSAMSISVADVNGDSRPDLVVANLFGNNYPWGSVSVLLGNGDGTFQSAVSYDSGGRNTGSVAIGDVNKDGKLDLITVNCDESCNSGLVGVLLGNGDGTFQPAVTYGSGRYRPLSIAVADVNHDGKLDLLVATPCDISDCDGLAGVFLGNGDGTFQPPLNYDAGGQMAQSIAVGDVNHDGYPDLLVASERGVGVLLGSGDGTFQPAVNYSSGGYSVAVADVNGDDKLDLVMGKIEGVDVLLGSGDGTFQPAVTYNWYGYWVYSVAIADVNGDGSPDLLETIYCPRQSSSNCGDGLVEELMNNTGPHSPTTTTLVSSANPANVGQTVTYTAVVTSQSGGPVTGGVTFQDGGKFVGGMALVGNQAVYHTTYKAVGAHAITATYGGYLHTSESTSATLTEYIHAASRTIVNTSGTPSFVGQPVTFTATVTSIYGSIPDGELVTFYGGATALASTALAGGTATYTTSTLKGAAHTIKASYPGDATFGPSLGTVKQIVIGYPTSTTLTSSLTPSMYGQMVSWTAQVTTSGALPPTGTVAFTSSGIWGTFTVGTAALSASGIATLSKSNLDAGPYPLTAVYKGDANNASSASAVLNQTVQQAKTVATITSSVNPSTVGQAVTFTARITSTTVLPAGPVTFTAGTAVLGTVQLRGGKATFTTSSLAAGSNAIKVTYQGNSNIARSSAVVTQVVQP
jgi:Big-like domain-containing protein/VCBS repeat protein